MQDDNNTKSVDCKEPETIRKELDDKFKPKKSRGFYCPTAIDDWNWINVQ